MKTSYKCLLLLFFSIVLCFLLPIIPLSLGSVNDVEYTFNNEILINQNDLNYTNTYNLRHPVIFTEFYNASFSFDNNFNPLHTDIGTDTDISILDNYEYHNTVIWLSDNGTDSVWLKYFDVDTQGSGSYEYYFRTSNANNINYLYTMGDGASAMIYFVVQSNKFQYHDGSTWQDIQACSNNVWYHIKIEFECGVGSYKGLAPDTFNVFINAEEYSDLDFSNTGTYVDEFRFGTHTTQANTQMYFDAIGFDWLSNYTINDNIIPYSYENTSVYESDKFTFDWDSPFSMVSNGTSDAFNWKDIEVIAPPTDDVYVINNNINSSMYQIYATGVGLNGERGIEKDDFTLTSNVIDLSIQFSHQEIGLTTTYFYIEVYSSDSTLICKLRFRNTVAYTTYAIDYYTGSGYTQLATGFSEKEINDIEIHIDYDKEIIAINHYIDGIYSDFYYFPTITSGKNGLSEIEIFNDYNPSGTVYQKTWIYEIGIYDNGDSIVNEYSGMIYNIDLDEYNSNTHNLLDIYTSGVTNGSLYFCSTNITNVEFKNLYFDDIYQQYPKFFLLNNYFYLLEFNFSINSFYIRGNSISDDTDTYFLSYTSSGIDNDLSYFYVDSNHRLQYYLYTDDNNTEYIQAYFNIADKTTNDGYLSYRSSLNGDSYGTFRAVYTDSTTNIYEIEQLERTYVQDMTTSKTLDYFVIEITDNDENYQYYTYGYISNLQLRYEGFVGASTILLLVSFMIPLLIILAPSLALTEIHKSLLIPSFLLMSIICAVSLLIPYWLLFIIVFCFIGFIITDSERVIQFD